MREVLTVALSAAEEVSPGIFPEAMEESEFGLFPERFEAELTFLITDMNISFMTFG